MTVVHIYVSDVERKIPPSEDPNIGSVTADWSWKQIAPKIIKFTSLHTGPVTDFLWDFGDLATSTERNPTHEYDFVGGSEVYTVVLELQPGSVSREYEVTVTNPSPAPGLFAKTLTAAEARAMTPGQARSLKAG